jgi:hypothetical protein
MLQFCHTQLSIRFSNRALTMDPFGLDPIEPGALDRQRTHHHAAAACLLDVPMVRLEPRPHSLADVPRGMIPDQQQGGLAVSGPPCRQPGEKRRRHRTDWPPIPKAEEPGLCLRASHPITRDGLGLGSMPVRLVLVQAPWLLICPGRAVGLGQTAPPDCILNA